MDSITQSRAWQKLEKHRDEMQDFHCREAFAEDPKRFDKYHVYFRELLFDYSKQRITDETLDLLIELAEASGLDEWRERMFNGDRINHTEQRSVLHTALRDLSDEPIIVDGEDVKPKIDRVIKKMTLFVEQIHSGIWKGYTGKCIDTVVNIGIGGSDLGPKMLYNALKAFHISDINVHFVSNLDASDLAESLQAIDPETTLFVIASKTFTTLETMQNAQSARKWFLRHAKDETAIKKHFVAISTNAASVSKFGIDTDNMFEFWNWVGGRYSLWSAIGLPLALGLGMAHFNALRDGAYATDVHFKKAPMRENIPVLMALTGVWNRNFLGAESLAVLPYDHGLSMLPDFLQQLGMESNGKSVNRDGVSVDYATAAVVWGATGNNGQHAFFQLLHQSKTLIPIDFIGCINSGFAIPGHQQRLFSNMVAQAEALMCGKSEEQVLAEAKNDHDRSIAPFRVFEGNVPSNMLLFNNLTPHSLGMLAALYEHKVFVQGVIWQLNSFDQWGVELGKQLAKNILHDLVSEQKNSKHDASTKGLMQHFKNNFMDTLEIAE
ncbi:MAG: Glucose-6-phosphate isomerase (EC [uncultured Thiotrichaceae bacterium]|uniref:Glucose-6-phosphate isomerase n=1 Tax=uncultured Thiotrichaceae bacterium TaxID=298394 RepID=A0A6S6T838_9GAMM|nr:MAG: Glucose-6-phosphate isomerase (EC [uncultured Thiotrichaceae bacterium]